MSANFEHSEYLQSKIFLRSMVNNFKCSTFFAYTYFFLFDQLPSALIYVQQEEIEPLEKILSAILFLPGR